MRKRMIIRFEFIDFTANSKLLLLIYWKCFIGEYDYWRELWLDIPTLATVNIISSGSYQFSRVYQLNVTSMSEEWSERIDAEALELFIRQKSEYV